MVCRTCTALSPTSGLAPAAVMALPPTANARYDTTRSVASKSSPSRTCSTGRPARSCSAAQRSRAARCSSRATSMAPRSGPGPPVSTSALERKAATTEATSRSPSARPGRTTGRCSVNGRSTISRTLSSSMSSWANPRARRASPVGRLAIAACACLAVSTFSRAASSRRGRSPSPAADRMPSTRSATASRAFAAWWWVVTRSNSGQSATAAPVAINPAMAQPPTRAGTTSADPGIVTAITKARSMPMFAAAT